MADMFSDTYRVVVRPSRAEIVVMASRFIADVVPAPDDRAAMAAVDAARKEFHAATHHCFAWRIGAEQPVTRTNDDGEPSGTAGRPILHAIERHDVTNCALVVTRYFGGTKLGVPGLIRAYGEAADAVLHGAAVESRTITATFALTTTYDALPKLKALIYKHATIIREEYDAAPRIIVSVARSGESRLKAAMVEASRGQVTFSVDG